MFTHTHTCIQSLYVYKGSKQVNFPDLRYYGVTVTRAARELTNEPMIYGYKIFY